MHIVILGGGIAGLLAAHALRHHKPVILEGTGKLGGMFTAGGLKYLHDTAAMRELLETLRVDWRPANPVGALYLDGEVYPHPGWMASLDADRRLLIQRRHWMKTRCTDFGFREDCMNDPLGGNGLALDCNHSEFIDRLAAAAQEHCHVRLGSFVTEIQPDHIQVKEGASHASWHYDLLIPTIPLGAMAKLAPWAKLPKAEPSKLGIMELVMPYKQRAWDYMYTPGLRRVSRIVWQHDMPWQAAGQSRLSAEFPIHTFERPFNWAMSENMEMVDVLIEANMAINGDRTADMVWGDIRLIPGHLLPLLEQPVWPGNWHPLGRFTEWDSRATADKVYDRALQLANS